jgi:NAD(P)-dependent dehydrogenase (short-subunit alcohol dehydrogenase family)
MVEMKTVVITGSSRGIGFGLAREFFRRGHQVVLSSRTEAAVARALHRLGGGQESARLLGQVCDVSDYEQVETLWDAAVDQFGRVDIWINNAGIGHKPVATWEIPGERASQIIQTNLVGTLNGCRAVIPRMLAQGVGLIFNMEGAGSDGKVRHGLGVYGTTKAGVRYLSNALIKDLEHTPVHLGTLQPGMVVTRLITDQYVDDPEGFEQFKPVLNIIAERVDTVSEFLVDKILSTTRNGARIRYLTTPKLLWRFLTARLTRRDLFEEDGVEGPK